MPARHVALAVLVAAVWGVNFVVIRVGLDHFPPLLFSALRFFFTAFPLVFILGPPRVPWRFVVAIGLSLGLAKFSLLFIGIDMGMPAGLSSLVLQMQAIFTIAISVVVLGERPRREQLIGGAIAVCGLVAIGIDRATTAPLVPFLLVVGAGLCWGIANTVTRMSKAPDPLRLIVWMSVIPPLPLLGLSLASDGPDEIERTLRAIDATAIGALAVVIIAATLFGFTAWNWLLQRHPASTVAPFTLLVPIFGIASAFAFLDERPSVVELIGAAVVIAGVLIGLGRRPSISLLRASPDRAR